MENDNKHGTIFKDKTPLKYSAVQSQTAVSARFSSEQLPLVVFLRHKAVTAYFSCKQLRLHGCTAIIDSCSFLAFPCLNFLLDLNGLNIIPRHLCSAVVKVVCLESREITGLPPALAFRFQRNKCFFPARKYLILWGATVSKDSVLGPRPPGPEFTIQCLRAMSSRELVSSPSAGFLGQV